MAAREATSKSRAKGAPQKGRGGRKGKGRDDAAGSAITVAGHPRAAATIRRAKGAGGLAGFALAFLLAHRAGLGVSGSVERALVAGVAGYLIAWACALTVWHQIVAAQVRTMRESAAAMAAARRPRAIRVDADSRVQDAASGAVTDA